MYDGEKLDIVVSSVDSEALEMATQNICLNILAVGLLPFILGSLEQRTGSQ